MKVVYGHTDSIYVQIDTIEKAKEILQEVNNHVQDLFPNVFDLAEHPVNLEFEKYYSTLGVGTVKNRNAGMISWEDGRFLEKPKFIMTGFTAKRISQTPLAKRVQIKLLKMWVEKVPFEKINSYLNEQYLLVLNGKIPLSDIIKRSRFKEERFKFKCVCGKKYTLKTLPENSFCQKCGADKNSFTTPKGKKPTFGEGVAGILYGQERFDTQYEDSYLYLKVKGVNDYFTNPLTGEKRPAEYISVNRESEFVDYIPDWKHYADSILKKAEPIYKAMDWDITSIKSGRIQLSLDEWW